MMMNRRRFLMLVIVEPLRLGITIQINICNADKATKRPWLTCEILCLPVEIMTEKNMHAYLRKRRGSKANPEFFCGHLNAIFLESLTSSPLPKTREEGATKTNENLNHVKDISYWSDNCEDCFKGYTVHSRLEASKRIEDQQTKKLSMLPKRSESISALMVLEDPISFCSLSHNPRKLYTIF
jgi:hypothetical protein